MTRRSIVLLVSGALFACSGSVFNDVGQLGGTGGGGGISPGGRGGIDSGGRGGIASRTGGGPSVTGGSGGATNQGGRLVVDGTNIRAVDAHADYLYWVEYGTTDNLNNYQYNGRLLRQPLGGGQTEVISSTLAGPVGLVVTDNNAYVYLDKDPTNREIIARVPLSGGDAELVHVGTVSVSPTYFGAYCYRGCLCAIGGQVYFSQAGSIYTVSDTSGAAEAPFLTDVYARTLDVDATHVYYNASDPTLGEGLYRSLRTGGAPESMSASLGASNPPLQPNVYGDYVYTALDSGDGSSDGTGGWTGSIVYVSRVAKADKRWMNVAAIDHAETLDLMQIAADRYFVQVFAMTYGYTTRFVSGSLADPANATTLHTSTNQELYSWVGTRLGVFWVENGKIYAAP